jgi:adenine specific DNA methylase Mod
MPAYKGKIKMIYIDPPYNTGHKFCYKDNFKQETEIFHRYLLNPIPIENKKSITNGTEP